MIATKFNKLEESFQTIVFLDIVGPDALEMFVGFNFDHEEDKKDLKKVMKKFEDVCVGQSHEALESNFHMRRQEPGESNEALAAPLSELAEICNFEDAQLEDQRLSLASYLPTGRARETYTSSRQQSHSVSAGQEGSSSSMQVNRPQAQPTEEYRFQTQTYHAKKEKKFRCTRCGRSPVHDRNNCPARDAECRKCYKTGHFAAVCKSRNAARRHYSAYGY